MATAWGLPGDRMEHQAWHRFARRVVLDVETRVVDEGASSSLPVLRLILKGRGVAAAGRAHPIRLRQPAPAGMDRLGATAQVGHVAPGAPPRHATSARAGTPCRPWAPRRRPARRVQQPRRRRTAHARPPRHGCSVRGPAPTDHGRALEVSRVLRPVDALTRYRSEWSRRRSLATAMNSSGSPPTRLRIENRGGNPATVHRGGLHRGLEFAHVAAFTVDHEHAAAILVLGTTQALMSPRLNARWFAPISARSSRRIRTAA